MSARTYGTYTLFLLVIALGAWVVHDVVSGTAPTELAAGEPAEQPPPAPVNLTLAPAEPSPVKVVLVPDGSTPQSVASGDEGGEQPVPVLVQQYPAPVGGPPRAVPGFAAEGSGGSPSQAGQVVLVTPDGGQGPGTDPSPESGMWGGHQVVAMDGSVVFIGPNGQLIANTGAASASGVIGLGVKGSTLESGTSTSQTSPPAAPPTATPSPSGTPAPPPGAAPSPSSSPRSPSPNATPSKAARPSAARPDAAVSGAGLASAAPSSAAPSKAASPSAATVPLGDEPSRAPVDDARPASADVSCPTPVVVAHAVPDGAPLPVLTDEDCRITAADSVGSGERCQPVDCLSAGSP
jgi:hypothetical protein